MSHTSDLFHRKAFGRLAGGYFEGWKASGDILHVGPATVKNARFEWDDVPDDKFRTARTRSYKLAPPEDNSKYGAMVLQSWMWDRNTIFSVKNVEDHVPQTVLDAMRNDENLLLDSDDLTKDGFETVIDQESVVCRASITNGQVQLATPSNLSAGATVLGCFGRVLLQCDRVEGYCAVGYEPWPTGVRFADWLPQQLASSVLPVARIAPHAVDGPWPLITEDRGGGPVVNGEILLKFASAHAFQAYAFQRPNKNYKEYVRLIGNLYARPLKGYRCFDRRALQERATDHDTQQELAKGERSPLLGGEFLLPAIDGRFKIDVQPEWIICPVISVAPALAVDAKWALGVHGYFNFPYYISTTSLALTMCPPMSVTHVTALAAQLFVDKPATKVKLAHHVLQKSILEQYPCTQGPDPFSIEFSFFPLEWWKALIAHINVPARRCDYDSSVLEVLLSGHALELFVGATMLQVTRSRSLKAPDFLMLQGFTGKRPRNATTLPVGAARFNLDKSALRLKVGVAIVKGTTVKGSISVPYPDNDPPDGGYWVFSARLRQWVSNTVGAGTVAELRRLYPALAEFAAHVVD